MGFGNTAFKEIKSNEVIRVGPSSTITGVLIKERVPAVCPQRKGRVRTRSGGSTPIQGERLQEKPTLPKPPSQASRPQSPEKMNLCCLSHPVCGILLRQP